MLSISSGPETPQVRRNVRYLAGAALCALVNNVVLIGVDAFGGPLIAGVLLSWLCGGVTGFVWHSQLTYKTPLSSAAFLRFMTGVLIGIPLSWGVLWLLTHVLGWSMWLASPTATVALFCYNYLNAFVAIRWKAAWSTIKGWWA